MLRRRLAVGGPFLLAKGLEPPGEGRPGALRARREVVEEKRREGIERMEEDDP